MKSKSFVFNALSRAKLINILSKIPDKKDLIIDPKVIKPLENIIDVSVLRSLDVHKIYKITNSNILSTCSVRVFLIYTDLILVKYICDHINAEQVKDVKFYLVLIPRKLFSIMQLLEEEGVYEYITVFSFSWELIHFDNLSILSLELKHFFDYLFVHGDQSFLPIVAKSIWSSFLLWGNPSVQISIGNYSHSICKMIDSHFYDSYQPKKTSSDIDCFIIVDRNTDYISTLLTPATYTSLLDEVFEIQSSFIEINDGLVISLNKPNEIYLQIKNRHFSHVIPFLKDKAKKIQEDYDKSQKMKLEEIKQYIKKDLANITEQKLSLSHHISACEMIVKTLGDRFEKFIAAEENIMEDSFKYKTINFIEECIVMNFADKFSILRLICLLSITQNGISIEEANKLKTLFLNVYGYDCLPLFHNLEKIGLFMLQPNFNLTDVTPSGLANKVAQVVPLSSKKNTINQMIQKLKLIPSCKDLSNFKKPLSMNYVFSGLYTPAICQLVNLLNKNEILKDEIHKYFPNSKVNVFNNVTTMHTFFVYFVGGITYAEVAAFQLLEKLTGCQILLGATNTVNGNSICKSCET